LTDRLVGHAGVEMHVVMERRAGVVQEGDGNETRAGTGASAPLSAADMPQSSRSISSRKILVTAATTAGGAEFSARA